MPEFEHGGARVGDIFERIGATTNFQGCCAALLTHLLEASSDGRGAIVARLHGDPRAAGCRVGDGTVREIEAAAHAQGSPLGRVLRGERVDLGDSVGELSPSLVVPFSEGAEAGRGVLLAEGLEGKEPYARDLLHRSSGLLLRHLELEDLREGVGRSEPADDNGGPARTVRLNTYLLDGRLPRVPLTAVRSPGIENGKEKGTGSPRDDQWARDPLSDIAHGLKDPLQGIVGYADLMEMGRFGPLAPPLRAVVEKLCLHGQRLTGRLNLALGLMGLAAETAKRPTREAAHPGKAARQAARRLSEEADERGVRLEVHVEESIPAVTGTADRLTILFHALMSLGLASAGPGTLRLEAYREEGDWIRFRLEGVVAYRGDGKDEGEPKSVLMERTILTLLTGGLGGRVEFSGADVRGPGTVVYLPRARREV